MNQRLPLAWLCALVVSLLLSSSQISFAATTDTIFSEDFSSLNFPPTGWTDNSYDQWSGGSGWYAAADGYNGSNGSLICDIWDGSTGMLLTPSLDASQWSSSTDTAYVDFDFFWEYDYYNRDYGSGIDDNFQMYLVNSNGQTQVLNLYTSTAYTYYNQSYNWTTDPPTSTDAWRHYRIGIPKDYRVDGLQIGWQALPNFGAGNAAIDNVIVSGTHYNTLTVTPTTTINFGTVDVGDTMTKSIVLTNPNSIPVNISNLVVTGPDYTLVRTPSTVAANSSDSIIVAFIPTLGGTRTGAVSFNTDADIPTSVSINLTGTGVSPVLSLSTMGPLFFHTRVKLGQSLTQSIAVSNTSAGLLRILPGTSIGGDYPGEYTITRLPSEGIPAGTTDTISVTYTPTMEGLHAANLNIVSNGGNASIQLLGLGTLPRLAVTPSALTFPPVPVGTQECQNVTLSNPGSDTLIVRGDFFSSADYDFVLTPLHGTDTIIPPGASKTVNVCFTPLRSGTRVATLHIATNIPMTIGETPVDTSGFDVSITGTGLSVGKLAFGLMRDSAIVGNTACVMDTLINVGEAPITVTSATFTGADSAEFAFNSSALPITVPAGGSVPVSICFTPTTRGLRSALVELTGMSNGDSIQAEGMVQATGLSVCATPSTAMLFDSTLTLVGLSDTQSVVITNCGDVPTTYSAALSGSSAAYTVLGPSTSAAIAPGATDTIRVAFTPMDRSMSNATLTVTGNNGVTPMVIALGGTGAGVTVSATGEPGSASVGTPTTFTVTVYNQGNAAWTPGTASIGGANAADFTVASPLSLATIPAGDSATMTIQFTPTTTSTETATLTFPNGTPLPAPAFSYVLTGTAASSSVATVAAQGYSLDAIYPNPAKESATISFATSSAGTVQLTLVDGKGNIVETVVNGMVFEGDHTVSIPVTNLASGTYFCNLRSGGISLVRELSVQK